MKFTIVTPTLQRESLVQCCESIDAQTIRDSIEHIVQIDSDEIDAELISKIKHPVRKIYSCGKKHINGGNTCRGIAFAKAQGEFIYGVDDDNHLPDPHVMEDVYTALEGAGFPAWGLFPVLRLGGVFFADPPRSCFVDTMNIVLRKDIAYWPDTTAYGSDGILVDDLMARGVPYAAFPNFRPIGIIPKISFCK